MHFRLSTTWHLKKRLVVEENGGKVWICDISNTYIGYLWLCSVQGHFGVIRCTCLKMACNWETDARRGKPTEIWGLGGTSNTHMGYLWPCRVQDDLGLFGALVSKWAITRKRLVVVQTDWKLGFRDAFNTYMGYVSPCSVQGHFRIIWCTCVKMICNSKTIGRNENWDSGTIVRYVWGTFDSVVFKVILGSLGALVSK